MTKEQEEAIEMLEDIKNNTWSTKYIMSSDSKKAETVLNMLKEKDRQIDLMAEKIDMTKLIPCTRTNEISTKRVYMSKEEVKQYFERKCMKQTVIQ